MWVCVYNGVFKQFWFYILKPALLLQLLLSFLPRSRLMLLGFGSLVLLLQFKGDVFASSLDFFFYLHSI
jgi:hypothetical protein